MKKRRTKIIATIHQNVRKDVLQNMIDAGADIIRLNSKYVTLRQFDIIAKKLNGMSGKAKLMIDVKDRALLRKLLDRKFDYLAVSFAESVKEIKLIKKMFPEEVKIISKIETKRGVDNIDKLIDASDGIMIARGDLGGSISFEKLPMIQKMITKKCDLKNKMSITATEMMLSMVTATRPSRAEVSDVANAILEGSEAVMLSEETAIGKHPVLVIKAMVRVIKETEKHIKEFK